VAKRESSEAGQSEQGVLTLFFRCTTRKGGHMSSSHDNVDVKVSNKINIYGNVTIIGSLTVSGVGVLFLFIWMVNNWTQAVLLSAVLVYGIVALFGLVVIGLVCALWIKVFVQPSVQAHVQRVEASGQDMRNRLIHA
jgi:hypothetical protein